MFRRVFCLFLAMFTAFSLYSYRIKYINETAETTEIELILDDIEIKDDDSYTRISFPKATYPSNPESPEIPFILLNFAVPAGGYLDVSVVEVDQQSATLERPIQPVGRPSATQSMKSDYRIDPTKYRATLPLYHITEKQIINYYDYMSVVINPIRYSYSQNKIEYAKRLLVTAHIRGMTQRPTSPTLSEKPDIYNDIFVNKKYARSMAIQRDKTYHMSDFSRGSVWYRMEIATDGMYVLDNVNLPEAVYRDADPNAVRIFSTGGSLMFPNFTDSGNEFMEIPIYQRGGNSGSFDAQTKLIFYAQSRDGFGKNLPIADYDSSTSRLSNLGDYITLNPYSKAGVYWLTWGSRFTGSPSRMTEQSLQTANTERNSGREIYHREREDENTLYIADYNSSNIVNWYHGFDWFMKDLNNTDRASYNVSFSDVDSTVRPRVWFVARANPNVSIAVNNSVILTVNDTIRTTLTLPDVSIRKSPVYNATSFLKNGTNTFTFTATGNSKKLLKTFTVEWQKKLIKRDGEALSFQCARADTTVNTRYTFTNAGNQPVTAVYQMDDFHNVRLLSLAGNSFIAKADINDFFYICADSDYLRPANIALANPVDLSNVKPHQVMIIYPSEFTEGVVRLTNIYEKQDYQVRSVRLTDVYDNFSGGHPDPVAIRNYLHYIQLSSPLDQKPLGAVFIGSGTADHRNLSRVAATRNKFPVNQLAYDTGMGGANYSQRPYVKNTASDDYYANFNTFRFPEVIVGRIPAKTTQELGYYLDKLETYIKNPQAGWWQYTAQIIADDFNYRDGEYDIEHTRLTQQLYENIKSHIITDKLFSQEYPLNALKRKPNVKNLLIEKLNEGRLFWIYFGHGSIRNCGDEQYFSADSDIVLLQNRDKYPIFLAGSCNIGQFDVPSVNSLAEELVFRRNAGTIVSIGATRKSYGDPNYRLFNAIMGKVLIDQQTILGQAFINAKEATSYDSIYDDNTFYNILGDPFLKIAYPTISDSLYFTDDTHRASVQRRQTVTAKGGYDGPISDESVANILAYDNPKAFTMYSSTHSYDVTKENLPIFKGSSRITDSQYDVAFVIPEDTTPGNAGKIFSMAIDDSNPASKKTYVDRMINIDISETLHDIENTDTPEIKIYLDNRNFQDGDTVLKSPTLIADISDDNGINTIGNPGKNIMIRVDSSNDVIAASAGFTYDRNSYTSGTLIWPLQNLPVGRRTVEVVAYDSFNESAVASASFVVSEDVPLDIQNPLVYPNPMRDDGCHFTFYLNYEANIIIDIYTITGRKIKTISAYNQHHFVMIHWNGRDEDGDRIANNTYFYKVKAHATQGKGNDEVTEKLVKLR